jgi:hypothetical protein
MKNKIAPIFMSALLLFLPLAASAQNDEDEDYISPVRPTVSENAKIQKKGVLQVEYGADFDFDAPDFHNQQTAPLGIYFAANKRLRLDFEFDTVISQKTEWKCAKPASVMCGSDSKRLRATNRKNILPSLLLIR